jgi:hypothetical protein
VADETTSTQSSSQGTSQAATSTSAQGNSSAATQTSTQQTGDQASQATQQAASTQQTQAPSRPEYIPESHWDATAGKVKDDKAFASYINEHVAFKAAEDSKRLTLPQNPDAYKIELPSDFKAPEGIDFKFKDGDPLLAQAKTMAHTMGISQENFSKLLGLYAGAQVADAHTINTARNAEIAKLGAAGPARVTAITTFFKAHLGDGDGAQLAARLFTAKDVEIAEKLVARFASQGTGTFRQTGRDADTRARVDDATYEKMSYTEKKAYAERHTNGAA